MLFFLLNLASQLDAIGNNDISNHIHCIFSKFSFLPLFACLPPAGCFVAHGSLQFSQSYVSTVWLDHKTVHVQRAGREIWLRVVPLSTSFSLIFDADDSWMFDVSLPTYLLNASGGYWLAEVWGYHRQLSSGVPTFRIMLAVYHTG